VEKRGWRDMRRNNSRSRVKGREGRREQKQE
jgi:hypothetical protein